MEPVRVPENSRIRIEERHEEINQQQEVVPNLGAVRGKERFLENAEAKAADEPGTRAGRRWAGDT
jgi:hypothetical protein